MKVSFVLLAVVLTIAGCAMPTDIDAEFGKVFSLNVNQQAQLPDGNVIRFVMVEEDSRCPQDAACFWEGNAVVLLELIEQGLPPRPIRLNTHEEFGREVTVRGYTISLYNLNPIPHTEREIKPDEYVVELRVTR